MKKKKIEIFAFCEATCPVCGKTFVPAAQHVYMDKRSRGKKVCSWHCVCESQRLKEDAAARKLKKG